MSRQGNAEIANKLRQMAEMLESQGADGFRIAAYRRAAQTLDSLPTPVEDIARKKGLSGLVALPGVGRRIAGAIIEMVATNRWSAFDRLTGALRPEQLFQTIPAIGPELAERIHGELHVDTLEALELAAHDGRLEKVPGIGKRRAAAILAVLAERLGYRRIGARQPAQTPDVGVLLDVDREYRDKAEKGVLKKIAPRRFNPKGEAWLPVLHTRRGEWAFTVLFSNTQMAHELNRTNDWVVIYFHEGDGPEAQCTVVTETRGGLAGRRVVRGHERDCMTYYAEESIN